MAFAVARREPEAWLIPILVIFGSLVAVAVCELWQPRRRREFPALRRRLSNIGFWILNLVLAALLLPDRAASTLAPEAMLGIDALPWPAVRSVLSLMTGFLVLDLLHYLVHRVEHAVPLLWRFHALHHTDPDVDVTTSVRHHPIEYLLVSAVYALAITALAVPAWVALGYALTDFSAAAVQHGNIRLPAWCERVLQPVLNSTDLHRIHHSLNRSEANANYGAVLSIWDRLFGTLVRLAPLDHERIVFGVGEVHRRDGLTPMAMMLTPWRLGRLAVRRQGRKKIARVKSTANTQRGRQVGKRAARAQRV